MNIRHLIALTLLLALPALSQVIFLRPVAKTSDAKTTVLTAKLNRAGDVLGVCGADKSIKLLDPATGREKVSFQSENVKSFGMAFTDGGTTLLSASPDGRISVWDFTKSSPLKVFSVDPGVRGFDIDAGGRVITSGYEKTIKMWDYATGKQIGQFPALEAEIMVLSYTADGRAILAGCADGTLVLFDARSYTAIKNIRSAGSPVISLACSGDGKYCAVSFADSTIMLVGARDGAIIGTMKSRDGMVTSLAFHPNNKVLIAASSSLSFWDVAAAKIFKTVSDTAFFPVLLSTAKDKPLLAVIGRNGEVRTFSMLEKNPDVTPPVITIMRPSLPTGEPVRMYANEIDIAGIVSDESRIREVTVNGTAVATAAASISERKGIDTSYSAVSFSTTRPLTVAGINTIVVAAADEANNAATPKEIRIFKLTKDAAVELIDPKDVIDQAAIDFSFKIWLDFSSYSIILNTVAIIQRENLPKKPAGVLRTEKFSLSSGLNQIELVVNGRGGERIRKVINVTRRIVGGPAAAASDNPVKKSTSWQPQRWAVVVGVSKYANSSIKNLTYADRDAGGFADFLKSAAGGGFDDEHVKLLLNQDATLANVKQALFNFLRQTIDKDLVVIYFAGHGAPEPANPDNNYLLCYDTDPKSLETTAFPMWDVNTALTRYIPSKRVVVFTDACHSGGITTDLATRGMSATDDNLINQYLSSLSKTKEGIIVFTASQAGEVSQELDKLGHGVFTYYLLEGLHGKADFNNDYSVTIGELMDYVEEKVKRQTNGNQHPTRNQGSYDKDLIISLIPH